MDRRIAVCAVVVGSLLALASLQPGLDYFGDGSDAVDALARGDWNGFFSQQPFMGSFSLVLRAPLVALVYRSSLTVVYFAGVIPCLLGALGLAGALAHAMGSKLRAPADRVLVAGLTVGSIASIRAVHYGHPEELLAGALAVGAVLAATRDRAILSGVLAGAAIATKQWAVLAVLPALLALSRGQLRFLLSMAGLAALFILPLLFGDPERFFAVQRAAGSTDPGFALGERTYAAPGARTTPFNLFHPFASASRFGDRTLHFLDSPVTTFAHPLILLFGAALPLALWRRCGRLRAVDAFRLLALVLALRCLVDPMSLDYYHAPLVMTLAACASVGGRREVDVALLVAAGLTLAFLYVPSDPDRPDQFGLLRCGLYLATMLPLVAALFRDLYGLPRALARHSPPHVSRALRSG